MTDQSDRTKVNNLIKDIRVAMLTTTDHDGRLVSHPMATQEVEFDGTLWFIAQRSASQVQSMQVRPQVNVAYSGNGTWVSLCGTASVVDDTAKLKELWNSFTDAWMEGGPEQPNNVLIRIDTDTAQYWDTPGARVTQLVNLVKAKVTGERVEGDSGTVTM